MFYHLGVIGLLLYFSNYSQQQVCSPFADVFPDWPSRSLSEGAFLDLILYDERFLGLFFNKRELLPGVESFVFAPVVIVQKYKHLSSCLSF